MARLFDEIIHSEDVDPKIKQYLVNCNPQIIEISNVTEYFFNILSKKATFDPQKTFPCVTPPFEFSWIETRSPAFKNHIYTDEWGNRLLWFETIKKWAVWIYPSYSKKYGIQENKFCLQPFVGAENETCALNFYWIIELETKGMIKKITIFPKASSDIDNLKILIPILNTFILPVLLAISFMHCKKQTKLIEHIPPDKVQRKRIKNNKPPLTKYYTLDIEPLKEILRTEGRVHEVGLQKALHICRGHFKDYSQGKGLFGRYKGLYWWDDHIRGNEEAGTVIKDYAVKLPEAEGLTCETY